jgi:hypothetical protein
MIKASVVTVRLSLTKGEGVLPDSELLTRAEKEDPRKICFFTFDQEGGGEIADGIRIVSCTFLYDGLSGGLSPKRIRLDPVFDEEGRMVGHPCPILEVGLNGRADPEEVRRTIWQSSYRIQPQNQADGFFAEDWNGYSDVLSGAELRAWKRKLLECGVYSGRKFSVRQLSREIRASRL